MSITIIKSVKQTYHLTSEIQQLMETFRNMTNDCIRIGLHNNVSTMKKLCQLSYDELGSYDILTYYKLCAISHAAGILASRKKSLKRGYPTKDPYAKKSLLISCYGFKIDRENGFLRVPIGDRCYFDIALNNYTRHVLFSDTSIQIRSFLLTENLVNICYSKDVMMLECCNTAGIDRNLTNLTCGNNEHITQYDISKVVDIADNTKSILRSLKRNDFRIRRKLFLKYGKRRRNRIHQLLHKVSKHIVQQAKESKEAIIFEDIYHIRRLYQRGNYQSKNYRAKMNSWLFHEVKRQIGYKAAWEGIPVIQLSKSETRGTSSLCPRCGERLQVGQVKRSLWCSKCRRELDRDVVAAMNISYKGRTFLSSNGKSVFERPEGLAGEAMKGNLERDPIILRVDASKLSHIRHQPGA